MKIEEGFGPNGLGILTITDVRIFYLWFFLFFFSPFVFDFHSIRCVPSIDFVRRLIAGLSLWFDVQIFDGWFFCHIHNVKTKHSIFHKYLVCWFYENLPLFIPTHEICFVIPLIFFLDNIYIGHVVAFLKCKDMNTHYSGYQLLWTFFKLSKFLLIF